MLTDFIFMKASCDSIWDEVDEPEETESRRSSAIMDQNTSSIKSNSYDNLYFQKHEKQGYCLLKRPIYLFMYFRSCKLNN